MSVTPSYDVRGDPARRRRYAEQRPDPIRWVTEMVVTLDVPNTPFDLEQHLQLLVTGLPGNPIVLDEYRKRMLLEAPAGAPGDAPVPPWATTTTLPAPPMSPQMPHMEYGDEAELRRGVHLGGAPGCPAWVPEDASPLYAPPHLSDVNVARTERVEAADRDEDGAHCNREELHYQPVTAFYAPPEPRMCVSPHQPSALPMDVSMTPPGSVALCPYTGFQFVVPAPAAPAPVVTASV